MNLTRIDHSFALLASLGLAFGSGCAGVHKRPSLFPNRAARVATPRTLSSPKVELRAPSSELPAEAVPILSPTVGIID